MSNIGQLLMHCSQPQWKKGSAHKEHYPIPYGLIRPAKLKHMQLTKEKMFDKSGKWIHLETFDDFDNGLSELIDLWSSKTTQAVKESVLAHFKEDLEGAALNWAENRAKSKKYATIGEELAEFEDALKDGSGLATEADGKAPVAPVVAVVAAKAKKKA